MIAPEILELLDTLPYIGPEGEQPTLREVVKELVIFDKNFCRNVSFTASKRRKDFLEIRKVQIENTITSKVSELETLGFQVKYNAFAGFLKDYSDKDETSINFFKSVNQSLSQYLSGLKDLYHELQIIQFRLRVYGNSDIAKIENMRQSETAVGEL